MTEIGRALRDRTAIDMEDESSQGYIFDANLENPGLMTVFESVLANPVTNKRLAELLKKAAQGDAEPTEEVPAPFKSLYGTIQTTTNRLESGKVIYDVIELENLLLQLRSLIDLVERAKAGGGTAAEATPPAGGKKPVPGVGRAPLRRRQKISRYEVGTGQRGNHPATRAATGLQRIKMALPFFRTSLQ